MNGSTPGRQPWKHLKEAKEYHRSTGYAAYTMCFNASLESEMMDASLAKEWRILSGIKRYSWGRYCDYAVDALPPKELGDQKPRPLTQEALGKILGLSPASMSEGCTFLKEQGYLRKDHLYLFAEKKINPLESTNDPGVNSDSTNLHSPYLRFKSSYLSENKQLNEILTQIADERNRLQDAARKLSSEMRNRERVILAAFRDWEREQSERDKQQTQQNQQERHNETESTHPSRLCAHAQNEMEIVGEVEANCTSSHVSESDSNSKMESFGTPEPPPLEFESYSTKKPSKNGPRPAPSLGSKSEYKDAHASVSQSIAGADRLTDRQRAIKDAIPEELTEALRDQPSVIILDRIDAKLGPAPLQEFTESIRERYLEIRGLGFLPSIAADTLRAWNKRQRDAENPKPIKTAKRSAMDQALEELEAEYGT